MTIDGKVAPINRNWIIKFQINMRSRGNPCMGFNFFIFTNDKDEPVSTRPFG